MRFLIYAGFLILSGTVSEKLVVTKTQQVFILPNGTSTKINVKIYKAP